MIGQSIQRPACISLPRALCLDSTLGSKAREMAANALVAYPATDKNASGVVESGRWLAGWGTNKLTLQPRRFAPPSTNRR